MEISKRPVKQATQLPVFDQQKEDLIYNKVEFGTVSNSSPKILAIDQASKCGWCCGKDLYGEWDLTTRKDESAGMKMIRFRSKLKEITQAEGITLIVYERVAGFHKQAIIHAAKMVAMIETFCEENGIAYAAYSAPEIKKFATGKGGCNKEAMVQAAKLKYGYQGKSDNEADAIHLYYLAQSFYK